MAPSKKTDATAVVAPPATVPPEGDASPTSPTEKKHRRGSSVSDVQVFKPEELGGCLDGINTRS